MRNLAKEFRPIFSRQLILLALVTVLWSPRAVFAEREIIVGVGTPSSCTEWALQDALFASSLNSGGVIQFSCGPNPVTITITANTLLPDGSRVAVLPPNGTTIDGGDRITLTSSDTPGSLMAVTSGVTVTLKRLVLQGTPVSPDSLPFGVRPAPNVVNRGALFIQNVTMSLTGDGTSIAPASVENRGSLKIQDSTVAGIRGTYLSSAPIQNFGNATIDHSTFANNGHSPYEFRGIDDGGAIFNSGLLLVNNSVFSDNAVFNLGGGGAIANLGGTVTVIGTQFVRNSAYHGGAIENRLGGTITVTNSTFDGNSGFEAGALLGSYAEAAFSAVIVKHCTFLRNSATWGGAIEHMNGTLRVENSRIVGNFAVHGGGVTGARAEITIVNSDITSNNALLGGGIYSQNADAITLVNSAVKSNVAHFGGGIYLSSTSSLKLVRTEIAGNTPDDLWQDE
jgi:hypothetical protein